MYQVFPSRRFLLTWRPPAVRNGIIKSYEITISSDRGFNRTNETVDPYLVVDYDPKEGHTYKFQVAARTELGNLSEATELSINPLPQGVYSILYSSL